VAFERLKESIIKRQQEDGGRRLTQEDIDRLNAMFAAMESGDARARPSKYWIELNKMNLSQLKEHGYDNFKRTVALNYFTFARILPWNEQIRFLARRLPYRVTLDCLKRALVARKHDYFSPFNWIQSFIYNFLALSSWAYTRQAVSDRGLLELREPAEGNPAAIRDASGSLISQDLASSLLEINAFGPQLAPGTVVLELGAGYGRDAYVALARNPGIKYVVVDIPPALWVSENYLHHQFPGLRIFRYRDFEKFEDVLAEFRESDIAFFVSTQITKLPDAMADLAINISSLHEMRSDQIAFYFQQFDRLLKDNGRLYFKQWKRGKVLFENVVIHERDYPIPADWQCEFSREAPIQSLFFEALYRKRVLGATSLGAN
jgi:putative sugar O-methyltransferase